MSIRHWWYWFKEQPASKSWFLVLILLRPIIDNFYELKETSPLASPLYIAGVLTPILILASRFDSRFKPAISSTEESPFRIWSVLLVFNSVAFILIRFDLSALGDTIKYVTPVFLFYYSRRFVQSREDLHGILTTFLISCFFPIGVLLYEIFFNPIAIEYISSGRGGGSRIRGAYADVMTYAIYLILFLLITGYYFLLRLYKGIGSFKITSFQLFVALGLVILGLTRIRHVSTWGVFLTIIGLFLAHNLRNSRGLLITFALVAAASLFFAEELYENNIKPLINKEMLVVSGESESNQAFNGRMSRWEKYFETWEQMSPNHHFFGIVTSNFKETSIMIGGGMHSDYVRLLFLTGVTGVICYVMFLLLIARKWFILKIPEKFLVSSVIAAMLLWSITTTPTLYAPLLYFVFPIICFALLPKERIL